jgi:hypothetical protein
MKRFILLLKKFRYLLWRFMIAKYEFEETTLPAISAADIVVVILGKYRAEDFGPNGQPSTYEEVVQIIFPNGAVKEIPATEINLKFANALAQDLRKKPKLV